MKSDQKVDAILNSIRSEVSEFVSKEGSINSSVAYEEEVLRISRKFAETLVRQSIGDLPKSRNSKKKS